MSKSKSLKKNSSKYHFTLSKESLNHIAGIPELYILSLKHPPKDFQSLKGRLLIYLLSATIKNKSNHREFFILVLRNIKNLSSSNLSKNRKNNKLQCQFKKVCYLKRKLKSKKHKKVNKELLSSLVWTQEQDNSLNSLNKMRLLKMFSIN